MGGNSKSAKKGGAQWGHCERQTEWSRNPPRPRSSSKTEFAIRSEATTATAVDNECLHCEGITGKRRSTENSRKDGIRNSHSSLPPTSKKHASSSWRTEGGTVIKFPSLPRGPREVGKCLCFARQRMKQPRLNGLFFQLPFRLRVE